MAETLNWISTNPTAFASLTSAILAASVALFVFAVTQFLTHKKDRTQFLTSKLEGLYSSVNEVSRDNANVVKLICLSIEGDTRTRAKVYDLDEGDLYGHNLAKQIIMCIRLYFPELSSIHQQLFAAQRDLNNIVFTFFTDNPPNARSVLLAGGHVGHFVRLMEEEIVSNRDYLTRKFLFPRRYRKTSPEAIAAEAPPPDDPITSLSAASTKSRQ